MTLSDLPPFCCPTLVQLARMLSTCHDLQTLRLERITILASPGVAPLEPVELKYLERLSLEEVDTSRILSILSPGHCELHLELQDLNNDADMLESLRRFAGQANIRELDIMFSETRSDATLAQLLHLTTGPLLDLIYLKLIDMDLRNSELDVLAGYSLMTLPPASISDTSGLPRLGLLEFQYCTIHTAPASFHNAITAFPWITLRLANCRYSLTTQDENNINEVLEPISDTSDFGIQLSELLPDRVSFFTW
ncbi:hypothetical protein BDV93DRAFT_524671 [Ceratobasidium sp. AG-I]|nr:hypothetical protein BDV93DRAFT_524671 [Ceratobasidium sp. AG-I]